MRFRMRVQSCPAVQRSRVQSGPMLQHHSIDFDICWLSRCFLRTVRVLSMFACLSCGRDGLHVNLLQGSLLVFDTV